MPQAFQRELAEDAGLNVFVRTAERTVGRSTLHAFLELDTTAFDIPARSRRPSPDRRRTAAGTLATLMSLGAPPREGLAASLVAAERSRRGVAHVQRRARASLAKSGAGDEGPQWGREDNAVLRRALAASGEAAEEIIRAVVDAADEADKLRAGREGGGKHHSLNVTTLRGEGVRA